MGGGGGVFLSKKTVFWITVDSSNTQVMRSVPETGGAVTNITSVSSNKCLCGFYVSAGSVFFSEFPLANGAWGAVLKVPVTGGAVKILTNQSFRIAGLVVSGKGVFFAGNSSIYRVSTSGGAIQLITKSASGAWSLTQAAGFLYWYSLSSGAIGRVASTGGAANDVSSTSTYTGRETVKVPAFPDGVIAARVVTKITQAGALGDPYGSGTRSIWWVYGVGPVKIEFDHAGGSAAPITTAELQSTNQTPAAVPGDSDFFPLVQGTNFAYRWTNTKHLPKPEVDRFTIDAVVNGTARLKLVKATGPINAAGSYGFSKRLDGVTNLWGNTTSASSIKFPPLGPAGASAANRNHFVTPLDLLTFGLNPILTPYPAVGDHWASSRRSNDYSTYGVDGQTKIVGMQSVRVPAGTFRALVVRSTLTQRGFPFGSGTRTCWFAAGKGLVKLVFAHRDGSVSTVELVK